MFCEKGVLRNFAKFTGKHLCQSLFFNKVAGGACNFIKKETLAHNFIKKETLAQLFSCEFCEISNNIFLTEHLWWLLLAFIIKRIRYFIVHSPSIGPLDYILREGLVFGVTKKLRNAWADLVVGAYKQEGFIFNLYITVRNNFCFHYQWIGTLWTKSYPI